MNERPSELNDLTRGERAIAACQLCNQRPWVGHVASYRLCAECGTVLEAIARAARVVFRFGLHEQARVQ